MPFSERDFVVDVAAGRVSAALAAATAIALILRAAVIAAAVVALAAATKAADLFGKGYGGQAQLAQLAPELGRKAQFRLAEFLALFERVVQRVCDAIPLSIM